MIVPVHTCTGTINSKTDISFKVASQLQRVSASCVATHDPNNNKHTNFQ